MGIPLKLLAPQDVLEAYYANVQRSNSILMVMLDADGKVVASNRALAKLFGKTPDELVGTDWLSATIPAPRRTEITDVFRKILATGLPDVYQNPLVLPDGSERIILWSNTVTRSGDTLTGTLSFGIDVTESARLHDRLERSDYLLRRTEEIAKLGTYLLDVKTGTWTSSHVMDEIFGIGPEDPRTVASWGALIHPDERDAMLSYFRNEVIGKRQPFDREYRIVRQSDKQVRWVHGYGQLKLAPDGTVTVMIGAIQDVTETRVLASLTEGVELQYGTIFHQAPLGIVRVSTDLHILEVNESFARMLRCTPFDLVGKTVADITVAADRAVGMAEVREIAAGTRASAQVQKRYLAQDGTAVWARTTISALRTAGNGATSYMVFVQDVSGERTEHELAAALETKYRTLFETQGDALFMMDAAKFRECNTAAAALFGSSAEYLIGKHPADVSPLTQPDGTPSRVLAQQHIDAALAGTVQRFSWRHTRADGTPFDTTVTLNRMELAGEVLLLASVRAQREEFPIIHLIDQFPEAVGITQNGVFVHVNPPGLRLIGSPLAAIVGRSVFDFVAPEELTLVRERVKKLTQEGARTSSMVTKFRRANGQNYEVRIVSIPITFRNAPAFITLVQDLSTQPGHAQSAALDAERAASIITTMAEGFADHEMLFDTAGNPIDYRFVIVNPAFERLTGFSAERLVGHTVREVMPKTEDVWIQRYGEVVRTGVPASFTAAAGEAGGKTFRVNAWRSGAGRFAVIFSDVTTAVREQDRIRSILDTAIDMFTIADANGICTFQSAQSERITGYTSTELVGKNIFEYIHPEDTPEAREKFLHAIRDPSFHAPVVCRFRRKDGMWIWLESIGSAWNEPGGSHGLLISSRDVTDIRKQDEARERSKELETVNKALIGRELRISELKEENRSLKQQLEQLKRR